MPKAQPKQICSLTEEPCGFVGAHGPVCGEGPTTAVPVVFVGEAPGPEELKVGRPFVGRSGALLNDALSQCGLQRESCYITNAVLCCTLPIKTPSATERRACRRRLIGEVRSIKPRVVVALGATAMKSLLPGERRITEARGEIVFSEELGAFVIPTVHPAAVLRNPNLWDVFVKDVRKAAEIVTNRVKVSTIVPNYRVLTKPEELDLIVGAKRLAIDTESDGHGIVCVGLSVDGQETLTVPDTALNDVGMRYAMRRVLLTAEKIVAHNWQHDQRILAHFGTMELRPRFSDTMLMSYVIDERRGTHGLEYLAREYLNVPSYKGRVRQYMKEGRLRECPREELYPYNALDTLNTFHLDGRLGSILDDRQKNLLETLLYPASDALSLMTHTGILVDAGMLERMEAGLSELLEDVSWQIYELAGMEFNLNSWQQVAKVLYDRLGLPVPMRYSTDKEALELLIHHTGHPVPSLLSCYRQHHKTLSTYVRGIYAARDACDRVRTNFNIIGTVTGRLSSSDPLNLQNITRGGLRNVFLATPGYTLIEADLSQAEVRCVAWLARDETLKETLLSGVDVHTRTACLMFDKRPEEVTGEQRTAAKRIAFALLYGMSPATLAKELKIPKVEAVRLVDLYFSVYPRVREWMQEVRKIALAGQLSYTPFGRTRHFGLVTPENRAEIEREAVNTLPQSLASDITLSALIRIDRRIRKGDFGKTRLLLTVHDSIILETAEEAEAVALAVKEEMERPVLDAWLTFPSDVKIGDRWGSLKKIA